MNYSRLSKALLKIQLKRWTEVRSPSVFWIRRCMNSYRKITNERDSAWRRAWVFRSKLSTRRAEKLHETNPMMGHRGVRLGITYPEISEMQIRAILEAAAELIKEGKKAFPEIMIPVVCDVAEFRQSGGHREKGLSRSAGEIRSQKDILHGRYDDRNSARGVAGR